MSESGNRDYWIGKQKFEVWRDIKHYSEEGTASWLSRDLDGNKTANGDVQDSTLFSAAHRNLPCQATCGSPIWTTVWRP